MRPPATDSDATPIDESDGLPSPRRYWAALAVWLAMLISVLDGAIANVALPTIAHELHASAASSIWIVNAYQLAVTVALLPLAALGDRLGYRRVYLAGLAVFTLGSGACALSHSLAELTAARMFQGLGAAGIMSVNSALVRFIYPKRLLGQGIGLNALVISISSAIGPTVAAGILGMAHWQWLFAINLPIGALAIVVAARTLPGARGSTAPFDWISAVLNAFAFGLILTGAENMAREGLASGASELALGLVAGALLIWREWARPAPLVPLDLLRIPIFGLSAATSVVTFSAQMAAFIALPFLFQVEMGRSAVETGLLMAPWPLAVAVTAPLAGKLADRYPAGLLGAIGLIVLALGLLAVSLIGKTSSPIDIVWRMALCGAGFGFFQPPNNRAMISASPLHRSGATGGVLSTARLLGQTVGAVTAAIYFEASGTHAVGQVIRTGALLAVVAAIVSASRLGVVRAAPPTPGTPSPKEASLGHR